ncbi:MAG TPA: DUF3365 domain-containing protein, partial [Thermoguttaceae bacterium]|nr:DUF3365 domain-containing protein [Thermoguttaceae bacterium]
MNRRFHIGQYAWWLMAAWTLLFMGLAWQANSHHQTEMRKQAIVEAKANFNKDQALRLWATPHGGVYVPVTKSTPPNPNLAHLPERDIDTPSGRHLTLMNPAYMLRQVMEEYAGLYGVKGRITSLKPLRAGNAPDDWEREALLSFEQGEKEAFEFTAIEGHPYLRLMQPMTAKKGCLKCHGHQGYRVGDVRGGVGVAIPMAAKLAATRADVFRHLAELGVVWLVGLVGIGIGGKRLRWHMRMQAAAEEERDRLIGTLESQNTELERFAHTVAHDLRTPIITIQGFLSLLQEDMADGSADRIAVDVTRISNAAGKMLDLL